LDDFFEQQIYELEIKESQYAKHAIVLTLESIAEKAEIIVACGGDGTINEVASCLVNTNVILAIIPMGSGNGLASNLKIPRNLSKALRLIKKNITIEIDAGLINNKLFFSNTGIGFDAEVIFNFEKNTQRKLWSYVISVVKTLKNYNYSSTFELRYSNHVRTINPFLLFISNSNEMGYKMSLTPKASLQDGLLDILIVPKLSFFKMVLFTLLFFLKKHYWIKEVELFQVVSLEIINLNKGIFIIQKDGESLELKDTALVIKLLSKSLKVCIN